MSVVKARKEYECVYCERKIKIGQLHEHGRTRGARYAVDDVHGDVQIGIQYYEWRLCLEGDVGCVEADSGH